YHSYPHRHLYNGGGGIDGQSILTPSQDQAHKTHNCDPINLELHEMDKVEVPWIEKGLKCIGGALRQVAAIILLGFCLNIEGTDSFAWHRQTPPPHSNIRRSTLIRSPSASHHITTTIPQQYLNTEVMDTAFGKVDVAESYPGGLKALKDDHTVPLGVHWKYKYLLDIVVMAYSARFMAFLPSDSVPVKMTFSEEFSSGWIEPW
ncbi:hypothetical protein H0H93_012112, partial [Arthromyces matolae]